MDNDFLLTTEISKKLYHDYAETMPIIDYHCHLSPMEIAENKCFSNITEAWLYSDHYKWRAMRFCGCNEKYITGNASDYEKFKEYCRVMPMLIGNPLYHWSHLELRRYFECDLIINEDNCDKIWFSTAQKLADANLSAKNLIINSNVKVLCTTDDPCDDLKYHKQIKKSDYPVKVLPAFRPDKGLNIERKGIADYIKELGHSNGVDIVDLATLEKAYEIALDRFEAHGCKIADHGMDNYVDFIVPNKFQANQIFIKALKNDGKGISEEELALYKSQMMRFFGIQYTKRNWIMQIHYGVLRNPNRSMFNKLGADSGFDMIYGKNCIAELAALMNYLDYYDALPKTIIYSINPSENAAIAALCGSFCHLHGDGMPYVTQGSAWWFNDNIDGMSDQIRTYANLAALGRFVGMTTDSRSFLSYPRHEYFRRILCDIVGKWVSCGMYPNDDKMLKKIICDISYNNANKYFKLEL